jgi:hypothetical protein
MRARCLSTAQCTSRIAATAHCSGHVPLRRTVATYMQLAVLLCVLTSSDTDVNWKGSSQQTTDRVDGLSTVHPPTCANQRLRLSQAWQYVTAKLHSSMRDTCATIN